MRPEDFSDCESIFAIQHATELNEIVQKGYFPNEKGPCNQFHLDPMALSKAIEKMREWGWSNDFLRILEKFILFQKVRLNKENHVVTKMDLVLASNVIKIYALVALFKEKEALGKLVEIEENQ